MADSTAVKDSGPQAGAASQQATSEQVNTKATTSTSPTWNTKNLGFRVLADAASAASAASLVAPLIAIIDRSIMENASGRNTLAASIKSSLRTLLLRPHTLLLSKPTALIFCLYGGTYLTANAVDTASSTVSNRPASSVTAGTTKFAASSAANIGVCIYKDQVFVRLFGPPGVTPRPVPMASYGLFALRDCLTIFASFNVPPLLGPYLDQRFTDQVKKRVSGLYAAQFMAPAMVQFISTPMHLLGLDLYNRPASGPAGAVVSMRDRWDMIRRNWLISSVARICRIVPAFGVGGVVNMKVRKNLMTKLE
ncbi:uncharacterized protein NECHADRAFT_90835 [Fusarium vanettenii 77-13-4]|uniref:Sequence orphan n=1 Tax=Fusarium vanettenii (strain ATCC MYA-4622 / CBS 123669 / FGSC 9596 / NRRL 45880 / 77-13-4) TaxID=660122 RepID=C7Z6U6_FUSV7|nr:uncharacterized protein NECHADRAFT_90835 [Fusarium vanettenii 77-13-4]EEU40759.1 predicted protein [Fusarium vanettenii 77-13-4]